MGVEYKQRKKYIEAMPIMYLTQLETIQAGTPAIADKWVILHELAHIMAWHSPGHHGKWFVYWYLRLVNQYLGPTPHYSLRSRCDHYKISPPQKLRTDV